MRYILDDNGYIESVSCTPFFCNNKGCTEYTGNVPDGYSSLEEWATTANVRAYKVVNGQLVYDSAKDTELQNYNKELGYTYSKKEKVIGTWIDGRKLYQWTNEFQTTGTDTRIYLAAYTHFANVKDVWIVDNASFVRYGTGNGASIQSVNTYVSTTDYKTTYIDGSGQIAMKTGSAQTLYWTITFRYTKTTD